MEKLYKKVYLFFGYVKSEGVIAASMRTVNFVKFKAKTYRPVKQKMLTMAKAEDIMSADYIERPYVTPPKVKSKGEKLKIGWILSPISHGSGGQNTITRFIRFLESQGHSNTVYIYEGIHPQSASEAKQILKESFKTDVKVASIKNYTESDIVLATGWETAYPLFNLDTGAHKMYFVQDFEPYFYGLGSRSVLAENTYKFNFFGVTAGKWLTHKLGTEYGMKADYFNFGVDLDIYKAASVAKKKKICFYARPVTERRAFEVGVLALMIFHQKHPEYEIEFFGWDTLDYDIPSPYANRGILSHEELAELYRESVACLVLSLTNVSLLPFELLAAGCIPVMNDGDNNRMVLGHNDYIKYVSCSPIELAKGLIETVEQKNIDDVAAKASQSVDNASWSDSYRKVEKVLVEQVTK